MKDAAYEATRQDLLNVLANSPVWETDLPGLPGHIATQPEGDEREVKIDLIEVVKALYNEKHSINGTEQEFSSSYEHLEGDTTGVVDPDVSFEAYF